MAAHWAEVAPRVAARLKTSRDVDPCEVEALWQLCMLEGGLMVGCACLLALTVCDACMTCTYASHVIVC